MGKIVLFLALACSFSFACTSDYSCGYGYKCVKAPYEMEGTCMEVVDEWGIRQYNIEKESNYGMQMEGECNYDTECPIGFSCDRHYKVCVKSY